MRIIAIETSTDACSAALWVDGELTGRLEVEPRRHVELILPMVAGLLADAGLSLPDLDGVAFGAGPGSFTGVRIAVAAAQGLGLGAALPLVGVSSLAALALAAVDAGASRVCIAQDARMGEVYLAGYAAAPTGLATLLKETLCAPEAVRLEGDWSVGGGAWSRYPGLAATAGSLTDTGLRLPRAEEVARLAAPRFAAGETLAPRDAEPVYLRKTVVQRSS